MNTSPTGAFVHVTSDPNSSGGLLLSQENVPEIQNCLGAVTLQPGAAGTEALAHATSEVMYVAQGSGALHTEQGAIEFARGDAIFIPAGQWHWLANTGSEPVVSVFSFPAPYRPTSQARPNDWQS